MARLSISCPPFIANNGLCFKGVTANSENSATGYPSPSYFYFKMGLSRDVMAKPMTIYIDEYRTRQLRGDDL